MSKPTILLDCDPGHDDAVAILMAAHLTELTAITAVSGNVALDLTQFNALITTQILEKDIPVFAGCHRPLLAEVRHAAFIHGESGLGGPILPALTRSLNDQHAVDRIIESALSDDDLWLVAIGPLTNVALALRREPQIAQKLKGISIMGGGSYGNVTAAAEFNIWADPEAAHIVFSSGAQLIMCGLDLTHQWMINTDHLATIRAVNNKAAHFVTDMLEFYAKAYANKFFGRIEGPLHDPCAVLAITHPELFNFVDAHVVVETRGEYTRGMTLIDRRGVREAHQANVKIATNIDTHRAFDLLLESIRAMP